MATSLLLLFITYFSFMQSSSASPSASASFLYALQSQCSLAICPNPPLQVDGNFIEGILSGRKRVGYVSIFFYASWCPFSRRMRPEFEVLSSMFPQVEHLALEQSSALPSLYSKYGIHSLPAILLVNQTSRVRYHGPNNLSSLKEFYERNTGFEASDNIVVGELSSLMNDEHSTMKSLMGFSLKEISRRERYLALSILFLCLRIILSVFPEIMLHLQAFCLSYVPHLIMQIFGETSQVMGRVVNAIDVRRIWTKLRLCKARNFHEGAMSARVWASSLASVSLGESSSAR
ncbi:5'-adenylylsulfate reductase-like 5 [Gastrolobium bilobum]|uniref:5'-adenylylsulfate reductase-like 5 n=1 Tax=Gastrolobium bilobum TaxID=150636 RepID=UPI002AB16D36|nr:5'-adenylylsulfate reductase-like 5 [Gastrolobium bilobum]